MLRSILVMMHVGSGIVGWIVGLPALAPHFSNRRRGRLVLWLYAGCVVVLVASVAVLITVDWPDLQTGSRAAFADLAALGAVMVYRVLRAGQQARTRDPGWQARHLDHVSFTYVYRTLDRVSDRARAQRSGRQIAVPMVVVATLAVGHALIGRYRHRLVAPGAVGPAIRPEVSDGR